MLAIEMASSNLKDLKPFTMGGPKILAPTVGLRLMTDEEMLQHQERYPLASDLSIVKAQLGAASIFGMNSDQLTDRL